MKKFLRTVAVTLALCMCLTCVSAPAYAADGSITAAALSDEAKMKLGKIVIKAFGAIADAAITGVANLFPDLDWPKEDGYVSQNFMDGSDDIRTKAAVGAQWSAGFASESVIPEDIAEVGYVRAGEFHFEKELTYKVMDGDDQCFKVVALNDGSGSGTVLFCSLDAFGITSTNVRKIRAAILEKAADEGIDIISINVTVTHVHSVLDTHGLGASILDLIKESIKGGFYRALGKEYTVSSLNESFMNNLFEKAAKAGIDACNAMQTGSLYFGSYNISDLLHDKQEPSVFDPNVNQIKFVPDAESARSIWLVNMGCHPVKMTGYDYVCSDYPEAICRAAKEFDVDVAFYQGAQLAITRNEGTIEYDEDEYNRQVDEAHQSYLVLNAYGKEIVNRMMNSTPVESFTIEPYLNIVHEEVKVSVTNSLIKLISKISMVNNCVVSNSGKLKDAKVISEVGYCELGSRLAIAIIPGEIDPAIVFGGVDDADKSWNGTDWGHDTFVETAGGRKLIVFGLTNDQIGYMVPDNDYAHAFASLFESLIGGSSNKHYEEMISLGKNTASTITVAFEKLVDDLNARKDNN